MIFSAAVWFKKKLLNLSKMCTHCPPCFSVVQYEGKRLQSPASGLKIMSHSSAFLWHLKRCTSWFWRSARV